MGGKKSYIYSMSMYGIKQVSVVAIVTTLSWQQKFFKSYFTQCIHQPNLSFIALMILELFRIMLSKCRHYTPKPRFQTGNQET